MVTASKIGWDAVGNTFASRQPLYERNYFGNHEKHTQHTHGSDRDRRHDGAKREIKGLPRNAWAITVAFQATEPDICSVTARRRGRKRSRISLRVVRVEWVLTLSAAIA
jgi:hypothetical protein